MRIFCGSIVRYAGSSAEGAVPYQPGATPQEKRNHCNQGLKARSIDEKEWIGITASPYQVRESLARRLELVEERGGEIGGGCLAGGLGYDADNRLGIRAAHDEPAFRQDHFYPVT